MEDLTIIIPTKERHHFLSRTLEYLEEKNCPYKIIIADNAESGLEYQQNWKLDIDYRPFGNEVGFANKIVAAIEAAQSQYVLMLGDDDYVNLELLPNLISYLNDNKECVAIDGTEIRVKVGPDNTVTNIFHSQSSLNGDSPLGRVGAHCRSYWPTFYALHRREAVLNSFKFMTDVAELGYLFQEIGGSILTVAQGKYVNVDDLYMVRQNFHNQSTQAVWWTDVVAQSDFEKVNDFFVLKMLERLTELSIEVNEPGLRAALAEFYKPFIFQNRTSKVAPIVKKMLPNSLLNPVRRLFNVAPVKPVEDEKADLLNSVFYKGVNASISVSPFGKN